MTLRLCLGLTGGVASGKSAVADDLEQLGASLLDADRVNRELLDSDAATRAAIVEAFGAGVVDAAGQVDRAALRRRIFAEADARRTLERILHPRIEQRLRERAAAATGPYVVIAVPLLAEVGRYDWLDQVLVVDCDPRVQLERLVRRDGIDAALAQSMIDAQASRPQRLHLANHVVVNDGSRAELTQRGGALHRHLLRRA